MSDLLTILEGDFVKRSHGIPDGSVDLVVTSPPYDNLRTYVNGDKFDFEGVARALERVLATGGVICWNVNDSVVEGSETLTSCKQKIFFREVLGLRIHQTMIYEKCNGSKPDTTRYGNYKEYVFVISKGRPKSMNLIRDKPNVTAGKPCFGKHTMREKDGSMTVRKDRKIAAEFGVRSCIWKGLTRGQEDAGLNLPQPAMMPRWLARDLIISWSNPGDVVLDPMAGSGTVPMEALQLGRRAIACERVPEYIPIIKRYCSTTPGFQFA